MRDRSTALRCAVFAALFFACGLACYLLDGAYLYHLDDDGLVLGASWRIIHGQFPYRDFCYVRTPITPFLHTIWFSLPEKLVFHTARASYYLWLGLSGFLPAVWALAKKQAPAWNAGFAALCCAFFLLAVHISPPMPWYTVDAVLFYSIGFTAFLFSLEWKTAQPRLALAARATSSVFLMLSALCKQNFIALLFMLVLYAVFERKKDRSFPKTLFGATLLPGALTGVAAISILATHHALGDFIFQLSTKSSFEDVIRTTVDSYFLMFPANVLSFAFGFIIGKPRWLLRKLPKLAPVIPIAPWIAVFTVGASLLGFYQHTRAGTVLFWILAGFTLPTIFGRLRGEKTNETVFAYELFTLFAAWVSSLSWTWVTCLFSAAPMAWIFHARYADLVRTRGQNRLNLAAAALTLVSLLVFIRQADNISYGPRDGMVNDVGKLFPKLGPLYSDNRFYGMLAEVKKFSDRLKAENKPVLYGEVFTLFYYLTDRVNLVSVDWMGGIGWETKGFEKRLSAEILRANPTIIAHCRRPGIFSPIREWLMNNWVQVEKGDFFCLYRLKAEALSQPPIENASPKIIRPQE